MSLLGRLFSDVSDVQLAQTEVDSARGRLMATVEQIQARLAPTNLVEEALEQVKARSADLAQNAGKVVRERPATVAATAAGIGLLLAHKPLARLAGGLFGRAKETPAPEHRSASKTASEG
jgi:ElaB/YqjD/DUF883 family membrane-anchored ribosome-binding protein